MTPQTKDLHGFFITLNQTTIAMIQRLKSFKLRTLLILVATIALGLAFFTRATKCGHLAYVHYCDSLHASYRATAIHFDESVAWPEGLASDSYSDWATHVVVDRQKLEKSRLHWEESINSNQRKGHYWEMRHKPWLALTAEPANIVLPQLPADDSQLQSWWDENIRSHIELNNLHQNVTSTLHVRENIDIFNSRPGARIHTARFFDSEKIMTRTPTE